jgi:hypothetical protein
LLEFPQEGLFELRDETGASLTAEVQDGHDDDLIEEEAALSLPDATQGKVALSRGQTGETRQQAPFDGIEDLVGNGPTRVVGQGRKRS